MGWWLLKDYFLGGGIGGAGPLIFQMIESGWTTICEKARPICCCGDSNHGVLIGKVTLPKFNMEPKNDGFQKESPLPGYHFQVLC